MSKIYPSKDVHNAQSGRTSNATDHARSVLLGAKDKTIQTSKTITLWHRLRFRRDAGCSVMEVTNDNRYYSRLQAMSAGLSNIQADSSRRSGPLEKLEAKHYTEVTKQRLILKGRDKQELTCVFESYAPTVFDTIRRAAWVAEDSYIQSLTTRDNSYLEYISNSGGGGHFLLSPDTRYFIKTNSEGEVKFLLSILEKYLQHLLSHPHSLLVKFLGFYAVQLKGKKKTYFLVMQNVFYSADRMDDRFDLKGCMAGRYQKPDPPGIQTITVLKDNNFGQQHLQLGTSRELFVDQITADSVFLKNLNVMDYSLLIGRQRIHRAEQKSRLPELVTCLDMSTKHVPESGRMSADSSSNLPDDQTSRLSLNNERSAASQLPGAVTSAETPPSSHPPHTVTLPHSHPDPDPHSHPSLETLSENGSAPVRQNGHRVPHSLMTSGSDDDDKQLALNGSERGSLRERRRARLAVPPEDCPQNKALHVVDGAECRYFFGIVDILTQWTLKRKVMRVLKCCFGDHSTMPPDYFCRRFVAFFTDRTAPQTGS